jgi:hypothetical protein
MSDNEQFNKFMFCLIEFMSKLHDCHACKYTLNQIHTRSGKKQTRCTKYNMPISRVRNYCIDKWTGITQGEINRLRAGYMLRGERPLVIEGLAI